MRPSVRTLFDWKSVLDLSPTQANHTGCPQVRRSRVEEALFSAAGGTSWARTASLSGERRVEADQVGSGRVSMLNLENLVRGPPLWDRMESCGDPLVKLHRSPPAAPCLWNTVSSVMRRQQPRVSTLLNALVSSAVFTTKKLDNALRLQPGHGTSYKQIVAR